jgi:GTP-dependent phosphoenolpyruvate carboxykinase
MGQATSNSGNRVDQTLLEGSFASKRALCQNLEKQGLLRALASNESEEILIGIDTASEQARRKKQAFPKINSRYASLKLYPAIARKELQSH